jgi:hypothetical protein
MLNLTRLTVATLLIAGGAVSPAAAAGDFWGWGRPYYAPPPVHVYDFSRGPTWTSNGWSYPAVQVYYPTPLPPPIYAAPACGIECRGNGYNHRPRSWDRRRGW